MSTQSQVVLTADQQKANNAFLDFLVSDEHFFVIQGAAGTGKSFLIKHLLETFYSKYQAYCLLLQKDLKTFDIQITATTNKAVTVIDEFLRGCTTPQGSRIKTSTIYSLLGLKVQNDRDTGKTVLSFGNNSPVYQLSPGMTPLVFVDEASFINEELHEIIETILKNQADAKIVYIGDQYQLAPVGQTFSAMDFLQCQKAVLDEVVRNSGHILATGTNYRKAVETGKFQPIHYNGIDVIHVDGPTFRTMVDQSYSDPDWTPNTSKILAWTNQRVQEYNQHIRSVLKLPPLFVAGEVAVTNEFIHGSTTFMRPVDSEVRVTMINPVPIDQYGVKGYMVELDRDYVGFMPINLGDTKKLLKKLAEKKDWKLYFEIKETWLDLRAVYSSSIHKAQGSTYETVFLDLSDIGRNWNANDVARLMYVGITRASKRVVCYGYLPDRYC
jgi:hypothetical protein